MVISFILLCGVRGSMIYSSKEMIVLQVMLVLVVLMRWKYTKVFFNSIGGMNVSIIKISYSVIILFALGGTGFGGVEFVLILIIVGGVIPIVNSWSRYVVNK